MDYLSTEQYDFYQENGYLVIPNFADSETTNAMQVAAQKIIDEFDFSTIRIFTTEDQIQHMDRYFLESGDQVRCFFEEGALDENFELTTEKALAINKIGHALHDRIPLFETYSYQQKMFLLMKDLGIKKPIVAQSQYIFKQPRIGAKVNAHTDSTFIHTEPLSCIGAWLALEDATIDNGCLCAEPGSHKKYPLQELFVRNEDQTGTLFKKTSHQRCQWDEKGLVPIEVNSGDLVLLHGEVVHASYANTSSQSRHAYIIHLVDQAAQWSSDNWLQRSSDYPFRTMEKVSKNDPN